MATAVLEGFCAGQLSGLTLVLNETTSVPMMSQGITQKVSLSSQRRLGLEESWRHLLLALRDRRRFFNNLALSPLTFVAFDFA